MSNPLVGYACVTLVAAIDFSKGAYESAFLYLIGGGGLLFIVDYFKSNSNNSTE
jgi:hypothetical protein